MLNLIGYSFVFKRESRQDFVKYNRIYNISLNRMVLGHTHLLPSSSDSRLKFLKNLTYNIIKKIIRPLVHYDPLEHFRLLCTFFCNALEKIIK